jgi:hypothetical protein
MRPNSTHPFAALARAAIALALVGAACNRTDDRPATWMYVSAALFQPNCATASCHSRGSAIAGLDFSDPDRGYQSLTGLKIWIADPTGTIGGDCTIVGAAVYCERDRALLQPFNPDQSRLVNMLRARAAPRMPPDRPLAEADIQLVESWILDGARKTPGGPPAGYPNQDGGNQDGGGGVDAGGDGSGGNADGGVTDVGNFDAATTDADSAG